MNLLREKILAVFTKWQETAESMRRDNQALNDSCIGLIRNDVEALFAETWATDVDPLVKELILAVFAGWEKMAVAMGARCAHLNDNCVEKIRKDVVAVLDAMLTGTTAPVAI